MKQAGTKNFLIRGMPIELYQLLEKSAEEHHRSRTQEALIALCNGLTSAPRGLEKPIPFTWGKKITNQSIKDAINEGRP